MFLSDTYLCGNALTDWLWAAGIITAGLLFKRYLSKLLSRLLFRIFRTHASEVGFESFLKLLAKPFGFFVMLVVLYFAFDRLAFPAQWHLVSTEKFGVRMIIERGFSVLMVWSIVWIVFSLVDFLGLVLIKRAASTQSRADDQLIPFFKDALKIVLGIFAVFFVLGAIFNLNVASLVAGLGIGGLAVALAAKESLENLLGSFTIFLDKPFEVGDLVQAGSVTGKVEKIGFRSTRIRIPEKSVVTVPNKRMVDAEMENLTMRSERRVTVILALTYDTPAEKLKKITGDIQQRLEAHEMVKPERRVCFWGFGQNSLDISAEYVIKSADNDIFISVKEEINYAIMEIVRHHGCAFASPPHPVYLQQQPGAMLHP